jgi:hypothetical protein
MGVDGVVVGSKIISELESLGPQPTPEACAEKVREKHDARSEKKLAQNKSNREKYWQY